MSAHICPEAVHFVPDQGVQAHDAPAGLPIHGAGLRLRLRAALLQALLQRPVAHPRYSRPLLPALRPKQTLFKTDNLVKAKQVDTQ